MHKLMKGKQLENHVRKLCDEIKERREIYAKGFPRVKLVKVSDRSKKTGKMATFEITGLFMGPPIVGKSFWVGNVWKSTPVVKVLPDNTFQTQDGVYMYTIIKDDDANKKRG